MFNKFWTRLPLDGRGFQPSPDTELRRLRRYGEIAFWHTVPGWIRPFAMGLSPLAWVLKAPFDALAFAHASGFDARAAIRLVCDCLCTGGNPKHVQVWRENFSGRHPFPPRASGVTLTRLGDLASHQFLLDKQATADMLAREGLRTPITYGVVPRGGEIDPTSALWSQPRALYIKPRKGFGGYGQLAVTVTAPGHYRYSHGPEIGTDDLCRCVERLALDDELLVQEQLFASQELSDLVTSARAPVLRVTTAREPGGTPFLHSAFLAMDVPGENPADGLRGKMRAPVDLTSGLLRAGIWFRHPGTRFARTPWNDAPLTGRPLPNFASAIKAASHAMTFFPHRALVNWELVITAGGPVIIEGNTAGDWILTNLSALDDSTHLSLSPLLNRWTLAK